MNELAIELNDASSCLLRTTAPCGGVHTRRLSSEKTAPPPPPTLIKSWLLSFSHYIALYAMLVARLGTRCDCRKLRAKSEVVRRRSINIARKCQHALLPILVVNTHELPLTDKSIQAILIASNVSLSIGSRHGDKTSITEDYYRLFFLHCTGLEFFLGQLLRTAQLFSCFSLNTARSLTSTLAAPPSNFVYSGLMEVERPKKKMRAYLLSGKQTSFTGLSKCASNSRTDNRHKKELQANSPFDSGGHQQEHSFYSCEQSDMSSSTPTKSIKTDIMGKVALINSPAPSCSLNFHKKKHSHDGVSKSSALLKSHRQFPAVNPCPDPKKKPNEPDSESFEKLMNDIQTIKSLIIDIHNSAPINPWAIRPGCRHRKRQGSPNLSGETLFRCDTSKEFKFIDRSGNPSQPGDPGVSTRGEYHIVGGDDYDRDRLWEEKDAVHRHGLQTLPVSQNLQTLQINPCIDSLDFVSTNSKAMQSILYGLSSTTNTEKNYDCQNNMDYEEKCLNIEETASIKRLRRKQYIRLSLIIVVAIGLFGSVLGSCIYILS